MRFDRLSTHLLALTAALESHFATAASAASWWSQPYAPGKWTRIQLAGHLIDSASNNHRRFTGALLTPPGAAFAGPGYDQEGSVRVQRFDQASPAVVAALLLSFNRHLAYLFAQFPAAALATPCRIGDDPPIPLEQLALDYVAHLEHHLRQLTAPASTLPFSGLAWPPR